MFMLLSIVLVVHSFVLLPPTTSTTFTFMQRNSSKKPRRISTTITSNLFASSSFRPKRRINCHDGIILNSLIGNDEDDNNDDMINVSDDLDYVSISDDSSSTIYSNLHDRLEQIHNGIGKRYKCYTQYGFLNVHKEPTDPFDTDNLVGVIYDGQIVTSIQLNNNNWILHDAGGWSITKYNDFIWLQAIEE